ncbi:MAG: helix-turn-helix domain-containing protein [Spirochaetaceae bacterium]|nr:helix-turn-helix domain-containing protein [Spirochaetaceae bacterium]
MRNRIIRSELQIGPLLKDIRVENEFTQAELSEKTSILQKTISALENGNTKSTLKSFLNYINGCNYHIELVKNEDEKIIGEEW